MQAAANAAAEDAAVSSSALVKETAGAGADAQKRYYQLAHRWAFPGVWNV